MKNNIKKKPARRRNLCFYIVLGALSLLTLKINAYAETVYTLKLKNGKTIKTPAYRYKDDMIQYELYGAFITIKKSSVSSIEKETAGPDLVKRYSETETSIYLKIPTYYEVKGISGRDGFNGIYESNDSEDFEGLPLYKNITGSPYKGLFYYCFKRQGNKCGWVLGHHSKDRWHYINYKAGKTREPVFYSLWEKKWQKKLSPDIRVKKIPPPDSVYKGRVSYTSKMFPNEDCNGTFSPVAIKNGWVKYKMRGSETELEFSGFYRTWQIRYRNHVAYKAGTFSPESLPEDVQSWKDINGRPVGGTIELIKYQ